MLSDPEINTWLSGLIRKYPELSVCWPDIEASYRCMSLCYEDGGKLLVCGNGGSAADSDHIVGELMKGFLLKRPVPTHLRNLLESAFGDEGVYAANHLQGALPTISLTSHAALTSAYSNDVAPDMIFAQQVYGLAKPEDALLVISTSGNSVNVVRAAQVAHALGIKTIGLTGGEGGRLASLSTVAIRVPQLTTPDIQERHLPIYHTLCSMLEHDFFKR